MPRCSNIGREPAWEVCQRVGAGSRAIRAQCELVDKALLAAMAADVDHVYDGGGSLAYRCSCNGLRRGWACHSTLVQAETVRACQRRHDADLERARRAEAEWTARASSRMVAAVLHDPEAPATYTSTCVLLYGRSHQHSASVILLLQNSRGRIEPISESREVGDSSVAATAMRGVAEELLGVSKAGQPGFSHGQTISLLRRLDASGRVLRHLGRRPEATHRSFVLRADHLFEGGIDVAVARFQANDAAVGVTLVPLAGLTGASGEVQVTDVDGQAWSLRDGRHLGERRIQAAKEDMSCDAGPSVNGAASASDSRRRCVSGAAQAATRAPNREVHSTITRFDRGDRPFGLVAQPSAPGVYARGAWTTSFPLASSRTLRWTCGGAAAWTCSSRRWPTPSAGGSHPGSSPA